MTKEKHKKLARLGADALATALLDLSDYSFEASSVVERLLASPREKTKSFEQRLAGIKQRTKFICTGETAAYARDLKSLLESVKKSIADPRAGVDSVVEFYLADEQIFYQCDDSNGTIGNVFMFEAAGLFTFFASLCEDKEWLIDLVLELKEKDNYAVRETLFDGMSSYLNEAQMRSAVAKMWKLVERETHIYDKRHWLFAIENLAKQIKDPVMFAEARLASDGNHSTAAIIEIAKLHFECGDPSAAMVWMEKLSTEPEYMSHERDALLMRINRALGNSSGLEKAAWQAFRRERDIDSLDALLEVIGEDQRQNVVGEAAALILKSAGFDAGDAEFLLHCGCVDDSEKYILRLAKKINGDLYSQLLPLAKTLLKHERLVAASVIYRALLDANLASKRSAYYHHGVSYLRKLDSVGKNVRDWQGQLSHDQYLADVRLKHKLKSSFWSQYDS